MNDLPRIITGFFIELFRFGPPPPGSAIMNGIEWTINDSVLSDAEGWDVFEVGKGYFEINRIDEHDIFADDAEAQRFVAQNAALSEGRYRKALTIHQISAASSHPYPEQRRRERAAAELEARRMGLI